jgi:hypothetical protein
MKSKPISYTLNVGNLKQAAITIHLNYLHRIQEQMIEEALAKSDYSEAKAVIKHIMEKK